MISFCFIVPCWIQGFDGVFFGRIDWVDRSRRRTNKEMEMIWQASNSLGNELEILDVYSFSPSPLYILSRQQSFIDSPPLAYTSVLSIANVVVVVNSTVQTVLSCTVQYVQYCRLGFDSGSTRARLGSARVRLGLGSARLTLNSGYVLNVWIQVNEVLFSRAFSTITTRLRVAFASTLLAKMILSSTIQSLLITTSPKRFLNKRKTRSHGFVFLIPSPFIMIYNEMNRSLIWQITSKPKLSVTPLVTLCLQCKSYPFV